MNEIGYVLNRIMGVASTFIYPGKGKRAAAFGLILFSRFLMKVC